MASRHRETRPAAATARMVWGAQALVAVVLGGGVLVGCADDAPQPDVTPAPSGADASPLARGISLFAEKCAVCHGPKGLGDGPAAYLLQPKPRDFSTGAFRLGTTSKGLPTDSDLRGTIARGMPGSAMPPWSHLPDADLDALVAAVGHFAVEGRLAWLIADDPELDQAEAREIAEDVMLSGPVLELPPMTASSAESLAQGRTIYDRSCAPCHDQDGRGRTRTDLADERGYPCLPRDFTQGIFKGSPEPEAIAMRILRGLHGSPMPATDLPAEDLWPVVHLVRSLVPPGVDERVHLDQRALTAAKVAGSLSTDPAAAEWATATSTFLPVAPLTWRNDRIEGVELQALHDGARLAIRLRWKDATRNDDQLSQTAFGDGVALQFSNAEDPPLFAMGAAGVTVNIWHWKAAWSRDAEHGAPPLSAAMPNMPTDAAYRTPGHPGEAVFDTARSTGNPTAQPAHPSPVADLDAAGFGTLTTQGKAQQNVRGAARYADGHWDVVFVRELGAESGGDVGLTTGETNSLALAVWDGAAGDRDGMKAITIWHRLTLAP